MFKLNPIDIVTLDMIERFLQGASSDQVAEEFKFSKHYVKAKCYNFCNRYLRYAFKEGTIETFYHGREVGSQDFNYDCRWWKRHTPRVIVSICRDHLYSGPEFELTGISEIRKEASYWLSQIELIRKQNNQQQRKY